MSTTVRYIVDHVNAPDLVPVPGVGPWQDFVPGPGGWGGTLRYRTYPGGLQMDGVVMGTFPANVISPLGIMPPQYRPTRQQAVMGVVLATSLYVFGFIVLQPTGDLLAWTSAAGTQLIVTGIMALD